MSGVEAEVQKGKAYVLIFDGTHWIEEQILLPDSNALHDRFHLEHMLPWTMIQL